MPAGVWRASSCSCTSSSWTLGRRLRGQEGPAAGKFNTRYRSAGLLLFYSIDIRYSQLWQIVICRSLPRPKRRRSAATTRKDACRPGTSDGCPLRKATAPSPLQFPSPAGRGENGRGNGVGLESPTYGMARKLLPGDKKGRRVRKATAPSPPAPLPQGEGRTTTAGPDRGPGFRCAKSTLTHSGGVGTPPLRKATARESGSPSTSSGPAGCPTYGNIFRTPGPPSLKLWRTRRRTGRRGSLCHEMGKGAACVRQRHPHPRPLSHRERGEQQRLGRIGDPDFAARNPP